MNGWLKITPWVDITSYTIHFNTDVALTYLKVSFANTLPRLFAIIIYLSSGTIILPQHLGQALQ